MQIGAPAPQTLEALMGFVGPEAPPPGGLIYEQTPTGLRIRFPEPAIQPGTAPALAPDPSGGTANQVIPAAPMPPGGMVDPRLPRPRPQPPTVSPAPMPFDPAAIEQLIQKHGGGAPGPGVAPPAPVAQTPVPPAGGGDGGILQKLMSALTGGGGGAPVDPNSDPRGMLSRALGIPVGISTGIHDAMGGAAAADPNTTFLNALAQGFGGAGAMRDSRQQRKKAELAAAAETEYSRGRDALADSRYDSEQAYERGRDVVADAREERKLTVAEKKAEFDMLTTHLGHHKTAAEIRELQRKGGKDGLTVDQILRREERVSAYINSRYGSQPRDAQREKMNADEKAYRQLLDSEFARTGEFTPPDITRQELPPPDGATKAPPLPETPVQGSAGGSRWESTRDAGPVGPGGGRAPGKPAGDGTYSAPFTFDNVQSITQAFEALPPGAHFIVPGSSEIRVKQ